jgi:hypothetical protein
MKKFNLLITILLFVYNSTKAQEFVHEFGKYSNEEFKLKNYSKDTTAEAIVIYDIGQSYFLLREDGYRLIFEHKTKIKIFKKAGFKYAQFEIPYYVKNRKYEEIVNLKGNTYNYENGNIRITTLNIKDTYEEKESENWMKKKFAMPDVKEGSVIEIAYTIESPYFFNFQSWEFQKKIPVIYSEYVTKMIPFYEYTYILQSASKFDSFKSYEESGNLQSYESINFHNMIYEFIMKDIPAFKDESFITSIDDYIIKLDFQLAAIHYPWGQNEQIMTTWPKLKEDLQDHDLFGNYIKNAQNKAKKITDLMNVSSKSEIEKVRYIDRFIKSNYSWNKYYDKFSSKSVKEFINSKIGNSADINLFYVGVLNALGIEAYPVLISTRDHGKIKLNYPFQHFFNYVIVVAKVNDEQLLLDATEPYCIFGEIPTRSINDKGLIIKKDKNNVDWIDTKSNIDSKTIYKININQLTIKDTINSNFQIISTGYDAVKYRRMYLDDIKGLKNELNLNNYSMVDSIRYRNSDNLDSSLIFDVDVSISVDNVEDKILISPFCNFTITENPLKQSIRTYPIDMVYKKERVFEAIIHLPIGYKLLPNTSNLNITNDDIEIHYSINELNDKTIIVKGSYNFKKDIYGIFSYFDLQRYFNSIVDKFNEKIVLVKI